MYRTLFWTLGEGEGGMIWEGITGRRKSFSSMPYSKVQFFSIQTPGFAELVPDSELFLMFSNGFTAKFEFKGNVDIGAIGRMISEYVLE